jgi:hypothetical protein
VSDAFGNNTLSQRYHNEPCKKQRKHQRQSCSHSASALEMASRMGIEILTEDEYRHLQTLGSFDAKTSSWVRTPDAIRKLGGAIFCDFRFGRVFTYHNSAESYYAGRGFRGALRV